jgi:hypothetical protein
MRRSLVLIVSLAFLSSIFAGCIATDDLEDQDAGGSMGAGVAGPQWNQTREWPEFTGVGPEGPIGLQPQDIIFGGSLKHALTRVLLVPPAHGDLGNPVDGPTFEEYLDVTIKGIKEWLVAIERFVEDYPEYDYLLEIDIEIDVFDGVTTPPPAGYDIVAAFVETGGPAFRGAATQLPPDVQESLNELGLGDMVHWGNRYMVMSLFSAAPRADQDVPDYPELNDLETVTMHEFAHVWGLGHTTTWTNWYGPDLMNSPYALVYGDGDPLGDGGIRTPLKCITSLNLYTLAYVYQWLPDGEWMSTSGSVELPESMEYKMYCRDGTYNVENLDPDAAG